MPVIPILFAIWLMSRRVRRGAWQALKEPETRGLVYTTVFVVIAGMVFYRVVENWSWVDALYFTVVTLTTVGYGDLTPQTSGGKLFTVFYILVGLGILGGFIALIADQQPLLPGFRQRNDNEARHTDSEDE